MSNSLCPMFLRRGKRVESAGIHIGKAVLLREIGEVFFKPLAGVGKSRRNGKSCARADDNAVTLPQSALQFPNLLRAVGCRCLCPYL